MSPRTTGISLTPDAVSAARQPPSRIYIIMSECARPRGQRMADGRRRRHSCSLWGPGILTWVDATVIAAMSRSVAPVSFGAGTRSRSRRTEWPVDARDAFKAQTLYSRDRCRDEELGRVRFLQEDPRGPLADHPIVRRALGRGSRDEPEHGGTEVRPSRPDDRERGRGGAHPPGDGGEFANEL